jgi:hypothetical protein
MGPLLRTCTGVDAKSVAAELAAVTAAKTAAARQRRAIPRVGAAFHEAFSDS